MSKQIAILGGSGFIGGHLVDHFVDEGWNVVNIDNHSTGTYINQKCTNIINDILNLTDEELRKILDDSDVIIHLASTARVQPSFKYPEIYMMNNLGNLSKVLKLISRDKIFIYFSTSSVYNGQLYDKLPCLETQELRPRSPYALSKMYAEQLCVQYKFLNQFKLRIVRPFNVYGPRMCAADNYRTVIQTFRDNVKNNEPFTIYGDGNQLRDFTHVYDVIQAIDILLNGDLKAIEYNIGTGINVTINDIARTIKWDNEIIYLPPISEPYRTLASIRRLKYLGYVPKYNVIQWLSTNQ